MEQHGTEAALLPNIANQMRSLGGRGWFTSAQIVGEKGRGISPLELVAGIEPAAYGLQSHRSAI